ncbi:MAG: CCA tRNA nucleotidyltransferase [Planctomycetes bacterium]|nr:CCA tRNA nucleotidyltransferase [Planctomycetota bacterium]
MRSLRDQAVAIVRRLVQAGHEAYFCGGCVRDQVLGREPVDYDVATSATPDEVQRLFPNTHPVGAKFGVVLVVSQEGAPFQVATFRTESGYSDGRRPDAVGFAGAAEDVRRRDFTMNGLLQDPLNGRVIDLVGGERDLAAGVVRAIGDPRERFAEDHLRLLRAVRFAANLGFRIDEVTWDALRELAPLIDRISRERIRDELLRILTGPDPARGMRLLLETGLLAPVLPEVARMAGVAQPPEFHPEGDVWEHTLAVLANLRDPSPELALGALFHDVGKPPTYTERDGRIRFPDHARVGARMAEEICRRFALSGDEILAVVALVANHMKFREAPRMRLATLKRLLAMDRIERHLELHRADLAGSGRPLDTWEFCRTRLSEFASEPGRLRPPRLVTGHDLLALGVAPGPEIGRLLAAVDKAQLDERVRTREEAFDFLRDRLRMRNAECGMRKEQQKLPGSPDKEGT